MPRAKGGGKKPQKQKKVKPTAFRATRKRGRRTMSQKLAKVLKPQDDDVLKMLAAETHIGRRKAHTNMRRYIWKRRADGFHIINLEKTWYKLTLAARIIVAVKDPKDVVVLSTRTYGQRGAIKYAHYTGAKSLVGKWVAGTFTNPQNKVFEEPRLVICDDPASCFPALRETSYAGIPVIALCGVDNNTRFVDCAIPCNNRGRYSIGLMFWLLAREVKRMRGHIPRAVEWNESVDLFFYRDPEEIRRQQQEQAKQQEDELVAEPDYRPEDDPMQQGGDGDAYGAVDIEAGPLPMHDEQQILSWSEQPIEAGLDGWGAQPTVQGVGAGAGQDVYGGGDYGGGDYGAPPDAGGAAGDGGYGGTELRDW